MISVLLPCFNESENIALIASELIPVLGQLSGGFEIVAINDGSSDNTAEKLQHLAHQEPRVRVFSHSSNRGLGCAIRTGIEHAQGDSILTLDTDLTFSPEQIPGLVSHYDKLAADCVVGSPFLGGMNEVPQHRLWATRLMNFHYQLRYDSRWTAYTPIFRIYRTTRIKSLPLQSVGFEINAEILIRLVLQKAKISEIPAFLSTRRRGYSKFNPLAELKNHLRLALLDDLKT